ncbi:MAG TPA: hypothetical protein P5243_10020, partial [Bacteroidales bacterium]|nr:hypothetical protein [Bacteroidales bacterium]
DVMCFAIDVDGYVWSWGHGAWGQLTGIGQNLGHAYAKQVVGGETGLPFLKAKAISAGQGFGMAVTLDGRAVAWGNNGATALSGGNLGDGTTNGSGQPVYIKTSAGTPITNVATISDGDTWGFITRTDNTIWTWGDNSVGQLGIGSTTRQAYAVKINNPPTCTTPDPIPFVSMPADFYTCLPFSYVIDPGFANLNNAYKYEWYKDGVLITGATSPTYTATQATTSGTTYKVKISYIGANSPCGMTPVEGDVKITAYVPEFTAPSGLTFCPPDFKVRVNGSGTYDYYTAATGGSYLGTSYKNNFTTFPSANVTQIAGNVYTVYAQEAGNRAGMVKPITSTLTVQEDNAGHMQIKVFEDLTIDSIRFYAKPYYAPKASGGTIGAYQIGIYGQQIGSNGPEPNTSQLLYSGTVKNLRSYSDSLPVLTLPVNITLPGSSGGEFYWIGFLQKAEPILEGPTGAYPYVDNVNGNLLQVIGFNKYGASTKEAAYSDIF